jgi:hypothetical protein
MPAAQAARRCRTRTVREPPALCNEQRLRSEQYVVVDRGSVRAALDREGIAPSSYSLDGDDLENGYVLAIRRGGWAVFFYARGREIDRADFETEDEACSELLLRVLRDPMTRIR